MLLGYELPARQKESLKVAMPNGRQGVINSHRPKNISNLGKPLQHTALTTLGKAMLPERHKLPSACHLGIIKPLLLLLLRVTPALLQLERAGHTEGVPKAPQMHQGDTSWTNKGQRTMGMRGRSPASAKLFAKEQDTPKLREVNPLAFLCLFG